ncbi:energy transducer TonB, partial [Mesorhizobium sp. M1A.F.Ca.IN.020.03.2.1]
MQDINHSSDAGSEPAITPAEPLMQPRQSVGHRKWPVAIIASGLLHGAAAAAFLLAPAGIFDSMDAIRAEGTDQSGANVTGSALDDQSSGAVDVTLVPDPQPVKRQSAQPAPPVEAQEPASEPPTPQLPPQAVKEATSAPDIVAATSPRQDDQSVRDDSKPTPATELQSAEAPLDEPQQPPVPSATSSAPA